MVDHRKHGLTFQGSALQKIIFGLLTIILCIAGWTLTQLGFSQISTLQKIERIPTSTIASSIPGVTKLQIRVKPQKSLLSSPYFNKGSAYYYYKHEVKKTNSNGNTTWSTRYSESNSVDFWAFDNTGEVLIKARSHADDRLDFSLPVSQSVTRGSNRHTEWRIEPNDNLFVVGEFLLNNAATEVRFANNQQFSPLISKYSESEEKSDLGIVVILMICGGISLFAFAALTLTITIGAHRVLAFLFLLTFSAVIPLSQLGLSMLKQDIVEASNDINNRGNFVKQRIAQITQVNSLANSNWKDFIFTVSQPSVQSPQVDGILTDFVFMQERYNAQLNAFPNNFIAWIYDVKTNSLLNELPTALQVQVEKKLSHFKATETNEWISYLVAVTGLIICIVMTVLAFKLIRLKRHIENIPTSKTSGLVFGLSELKGRVNSPENTEPLKSPLKNMSCFWYHYVVEEKRGSGKNTKWVRIENKIDHLPFLCKDQFSEVLVDPAKAEMISKHTNKERKHNRRYTETILKTNDKIYLIGNASINKDTGDTLKISHQKSSPFLITNLTEQAIMYRKANTGMISLTTAFSALMFSVLFYLGVNGSFSPTDYLLSALIAPIYMSIVVLILHYNDLVFLKQRAARNFSNIVVSMQKRADLIPNIEKIVKKFLAHEKSLLQQITQLRSHYSKQVTSTKQISNTLSQEQKMLTQIMGLIEDYPELTSHKLSVKLMNKLVDLENEIALMREGYNDSVGYYNTRIASVPDVFFARFFGFKSLSLLAFKTKKYQRINFKPELS